VPRLKASLVLFLLVWSLALLGGYLEFVPQGSTRSLFRKLYRSSAVLYIPPSIWSPFGEQFLNRDDSPVDLWFSEEVMIENLMERRGLAERAAAKLPPEWHTRGAEMRGSIRLSPVATRFRMQKLFVSRIGEENSMIDDSGQLVPRIQRINFLRIEVYGPSPEQAKLRAEAWVQVLRGVLGELATEELERKTVQLKTVLASTERKLSESKLAWREKEMDRAASDEFQITRLERRRVTLLTQVRGLEQRSAWLRQSLSLAGLSLARSTGLAAKSDQKLQVLKHQLNVARLLYQPDSERVQALEEQVAAMSQLSHSALQLELESQLEAQTQDLRAKRKVLAEVEFELARLVARRPKVSNQITREQRSQQLDNWDRQVRTWKQQLFQMRLQIRLARADGSSELIQSPRLGVLSSRFQAGWQMYYKGFLAWTPLATFLAFLAGWIGSFWDKSGDMGWRVEKYLDCPMIENFPRLSRQDSLRWANATRQRYEEN
jgi:hypothetical protein